MTATTAPELVPLKTSPLTIAARFRHNVQRIRLAQNASYGTLAERLKKMGVPTTATSMRVLLNSSSFPSTKWLELLARALDCDEVDFLAEIDSEES